jgi:parallel beta-helix repeat protein
MVIVATLVATSAAAAIALSSSTAKTVLTISSVSVDPAEAAVYQSTEWTVIVEIQDQGQQGKGLLFTWDWGDGTYTVYELKSLGSNSTATDVETHAWSQPGLYEVVISVWDGYGSEQNAFHNVSQEMPFTVHPIVVNTPPSASFEVEPEEGTVDTIFTFNASTSSDLEDPPGTLLTRWDWESDGEWDTNYSTDPLSEHQYVLPGVYSVTLEVRDSGNLTSLASNNVTVIESPILTPHDPIYIMGDADLAATAAEEGWQGNGSADSPYVIELYEIDGGGAESAIRVESTTAYLVIRDCYFTKGYPSAVRLYDVIRASVSNNAFTQCSFYSIYCEKSGSLLIQNNTVDGGTHCIGVISCSDVFVAGNTVQDAEWWPLVLHRSTSATLRGNAFDGAGIEIGGSVSSNWNTHDIDDSNTVNGGPVYYFKNCDGGTVPSEAGQVILANCRNMIVESDTTGGISLGFSPDNTIIHSNTSSVHTGISLSFSPNTTIESTNIRDCTYGMDIRNSPDCVIQSTTVTECGYGMWVQQSDRPTLLSNTVADITWWGIFLYYSSFGELRGNSIERAALQGLKLVCAESNLIVANNFVDNAVQASEEVDSTGNVWDEGYPSGGNYWSDYQGTDEYSGVNQTVPGSDGIGDVPYVLASGSQDDYPLMEPYDPTPTNTAPVASFTIDIPAAPVGVTFSFDASSSSDSQDPAETLMVRWDWDGDGMWDTEYSCNKTAEQTYDEPGMYAVALEVIDSGGLTDIALRIVSVLGSSSPVNHKPIVITSDDEFTEENGVVGGSGLPEDPYIISGWKITSADGVCIAITDTSATFVVCNVDLRADLFEACAVYMRNVSNGYIVSSDASRSMNGLMIESCSHIGIVDCGFAGNVYGVRIDSSSSFNLRACDFTDTGISLEVLGSCDFSLISCTLKADMPCWLDESTRGYLEGNYLECINDMRWGAYVLMSSYMTFKENQFVDCSIGIAGWEASDYNTHTISSDNTVNGRPILHYRGVNDLVLDGVDAGEVILVECENVEISDMTFSNGFVAVILAYSNYAVIENNTFSSCAVGARVQGCTDVVFRDNTVDMAVDGGISISNTVGAELKSNMVTSNGVFGYQTLISVYHSSSVRLTDNTLTDSWEGMRIFSTTDIEVVGNHISGMTKGGASVGYSSDVQVMQNELATNGVGLCVENCSSVVVHHNNFIDNAVQVEDIGGAEYLWDAGYPSGGNYWSDYQGTDEYSGVNQDEEGADGIGDTPYVLPSGSQDNYPFMEPAEEPLPPIYDLRPPIYISGDYDFTPQNGVVSGSGTETDPYVIAGWEIDLTNKNTRAGIYIEHTTASFVIRDCYIHDGAITNVIMSGISLYDVESALVSSVLVERCGSGVHAHVCDLLIVMDSVLTSNLDGVTLYDVTRGNVANCQILHSQVLPTGGLGGLGIVVHGCHNISVVDCSVEEASYTGVLIGESEEVFVAQNSIRDCGSDAIRVQENSSHCLIYDNDIADCGCGVALWISMFWYSPDGGTTIYKCDWYQMDWITICYNYIANCSDYGIQCHMYTDQETPITNLTIYFNDILDCGIAAVFLDKTRYVDIFRNSFQTSGAGVRLYSCLDAVVYSNNFIMNSVQAYDDGGNAWDGGLVTGGNYWSDYSGLDEDDDGIGDTPYQIDGGSQDNYPLMMAN